MVVTLIMAISLNGQIKRLDDPDQLSWISAEDQYQFYRKLRKQRLIVIGRKTYESVRHQIKLHPGQLRIVLTKHPKRYRQHTVPGQLEFICETARSLISRYTALGYQHMLVTGGAITAGNFLNSNMINELFVTVEPVLLQNGTGMVSGLTGLRNLQLKSAKKINPRGTMLLHYRICME